MPGPMSFPNGTAKMRHRGSGQPSGKTARDHKSGKWSRHLANMKARGDWNQRYIQSSKMGPPPVLPYPVIGF